MRVNDERSMEATNELAGRAGSGAIARRRGALQLRCLAGTGVLAMALLLAACGGGSGGGGTAAAPVTPPPAMRDVGGEVIKGTVRNGRVAVFAITGNTVATTALATGTTNADGRFQLQVPADRTGPAVIEITAAPAGGTATTMLCDHPDGCGTPGSSSRVTFGAPITVGSTFRLRAVVPDIAAATTTNVSFFTDLAAAHVLAAGTIDASAVRQGNDRVRDLFSLGEDITRIDNADLSVTRDISTLTSSQRRAVLLSAGALDALLEAESGPVGDALARALERARTRFVDESGQLIANEGELDSAGVSLSDILDATLRMADNSEVTVGSLTELRAEAERVAQLPAGQRTDGVASTNLRLNERERALALVQRVRNVVDTASDAELSELAIPEDVREAFSFAADDTADTGAAMSRIAMAIVDAVTRFRDGEASPIDSDDIEVVLTTLANGRTGFAVEFEEDDLSIEVSGETAGALTDLVPDEDGIRSTRIELQLLASIDAPGFEGEISDGSATVAYADELTSEDVIAAIRALGAVPLPDNYATFESRHVGLGTLDLRLALQLRQKPQAGIDPLTLDAQLHVEGTDLAFFERESSTEFACPAYSSSVFALSRCYRFTLTGEGERGLAFDALRLELGAMITTVAGREYRLGVAADLDGNGVEYVTGGRLAETAIVRVPDIATAIAQFGSALGRQGTTFCCLVPTGADLDFIGSNADQGVQETEDAFISGSIAVSLEANTIPLDPATRISASLARTGFRQAESTLRIAWGGRSLELEASLDSGAAEDDPIVDLVLRAEDGTRLTARLDTGTRALVDGEIAVNGRRQARLEERAGGTFVFVFEDGTIESIN